MAVVLAFAGRMGSGKTTLTTAVAEALGCKRASFGDYVRHVVKTRGLEQTRENLQTTGTELLEQDRPGFCSNVLRHSGWIPGEALVIDGLRHAETIDLIRRLVSPLRLRIVYLEIDDDTRLERLKARGEGEREALSLAEAHSSEQQVTSILAKRADLTIDCGDSVEESVRRVAEWVQNHERFDII
jgi:dephospho-CoA kinase